MKVLPCGIFNQTYVRDNAIIRTKNEWVVLFFTILANFIFPFLAGSQLITILIHMEIFIIATIGLNILTGYAGQISLGHFAFMAVGAYSSGILTGKFNFPFLVSLPLSGIISSIFGTFFGIFSLRVKGLYLAMATLAAHFIVIFMIIHFPSLTEGTMAMSVPSAKIWNISVTSYRDYYVLVFSCLIIMTFAAKNLVRTKAGRAFIAIRDNDLAAELIGIRIYFYKLLAFSIGCFYAGIAGALFAHYTRSLSPDMFNLWQSLWFLGYIIVGGMGSIIGSFLGVIFFTLLIEGLTYVLNNLSSFLPQIAYYIPMAQNIIFALGLILFLIFEPRGLSHRWEIFREYFRLWPYSKK